MWEVCLEELKVRKMQVVQNVFSRVQWEYQHQVFDIGSDGKTFAECLGGNRSRDTNGQLRRRCANFGVDCCSVYEVVEIVRRTETNASLGDNEHVSVNAR